MACVWKDRLIHLTDGVVVASRQGEQEFAVAAPNNETILSLAVSDDGSTLHIDTTGGMYHLTGSTFEDLEMVLVDRE